jgi:23S rRNA pseudouridine1911/1915/1917 synthase
VPSQNQESNPPFYERPELVLELTNAGDPIRLDLFLCEQLPGRSRAFIQKLIHEGQIQFIDDASGRGVKASSTVAALMRVKVTLPAVRKLNLAPENIPLQILFEDRDIAVIDKPAGLVVHPSPNQEGATLVHGLLFHLKDLSGIGGEERPGIVHRLDRDTSGIMIVAKSDRAHHQLSTQFKSRTVSKIYWAILRGEPTASEGRLDLPIGRSFYHRKKMMVRVDRGAREAVTEYSILEEFDGYALAEVRPRTGRTHQIRVHMAKIRMPVACDQLYGREKRIYLSELRGLALQPGEKPIIERQALHARSIRFRHPVTAEEMSFVAEIPPDLQALLEALRAHRPPRAKG